MKVGYLGVVVAALVASVPAEPAPCKSSRTNPQVDLGYAVHEASHNTSEGYYAFKNIRYGDPPVNELRFQPSKPVSTTNLTVSDGSVGFKCPQSYPEWALHEAAAEAGVTTEQMLHTVLNDPLVSEDCLFLDVLVPDEIFEMAGSETTGGGKHLELFDESVSRLTYEASVMVWLHGGGYVFGYKDEEQYNPSGIIARSRAGETQGVIFVAVNYRLGLFGWLNGFSDDAILPNVGLHDQRLALDWVQRYIELFGGDPNSVTVLGHSAGGGSIVHHITADGGGREIPFQRAIVQSPGWETINVEEVWNTTLTVASNISGQAIGSGADLAALAFTTLNQINGAVVFSSKNGSFAYSPTIDSGYVPDYPERLLLHGRFNSGPDLMVGHNANEAGLFVSPGLETEEDLLSGLDHVFQNFQDEAVEYILNELYPAPSESDGLYSSHYERACLIVSESSFVCHTRTLATAFTNETWNYRFEVPPAVHQQDIPWTFFHGNASGVSSELAGAMQIYFTSFAKTGNPNDLGTLPEWPGYNDEAMIATFGVSGVGGAEDDAKNRRCEFWQRGDYRK